MTKHEMSELGYGHYSEKGSHEARSEYWKNMRKYQQQIVEPHVLKTEAVRARRNMRRIIKP